MPFITERYGNNLRRGLQIQHHERDFVTATYDKENIREYEVVKNAARKNTRSENRSTEEKLVSLNE
jgi:hypothetical protein